MQRKAPLVTAPIEYPERDGKPMGETDLHRQVIMDLISALQEHFRERRLIYVTGDLLLYYEEGNPSAVVVPDVFVVVGVQQGQRRTYKLWEEGAPPTCVIEVSSRSTRREDQGNKRELYAHLGVQEYYLFDPLGEYLRPPLQGYRLVEGEYVRMLPNEAGVLACATLGLTLHPEKNYLALYDATTGQRLLNPAEFAAARREADDKAQIFAAAQREAEAQAQTLAAEVARLRAEIERLKEQRTEN
jgi:Uma2 family endonuclease